MVSHNITLSLSYDKQYSDHQGLGRQEGTGGRSVTISYCKVEVGEQTVSHNVLLSGQGRGLFWSVIAKGGGISEEYVTLKHLQTSSFEIIFQTFLHDQHFAWFKKNIDWPSPQRRENVMTLIYFPPVTSPINHEQSLRGYILQMPYSWLIVCSSEGVSLKSYISVRCINISLHCWMPGLNRQGPHSLEGGEWSAPTLHILHRLL